MSNKPHNCKHTEDIGVDCFANNGCTSNQFWRQANGGYCAEKLTGCVKQSLHEDGKTEVCN